MDKRNSASDDCFTHSKFLFKLFGLGDCKSILYKIYAVCLLLLLTIYQILIIPEIKKVQDFDEFVYCVLFGISQSTGIISAYYIHWNRSKLEKVFEKIETLKGLSVCDNGIDGYEFMKKYNNWIRKQSYFGSIMTLTSILNFILTSIVLSINKEEWVLPFGCGLDLNNNNIKYIINIMAVGILGILLVSNIFMYVNMLTFIYGHCKLFQKHLISIMDCPDKNSLQENEDHIISNNLQASNKANDIIDWKTFKLKLRKLIPYHVGIYETGAEIEDTFCMVVLVWFLGLSICSCLLLYHMTTVNIISFISIRNFLGVFAINLTMFLLCVWGEEVISASGNIANISYELDFIGSDIRIQKALLIIMIRSQKPIVPTIGKFKMLCLSTMLGILQSTYSYYTILQNLKAK